MADLFSVTAPLAIRWPSGERRIMIRTFRHPRGLLFFEPFWQPDGTGAMLVEGDIRGEGPWKVGDCVITVLGCHGTDAELAAQFAEWQFHLEQQGGRYEHDGQMQAVARRHGS